jgi:hypothetical protein
VAEQTTSGIKVGCAWENATGRRIVFLEFNSEEIRRQVAHGRNMVVEPDMAIKLAELMTRHALAECKCQPVRADESGAG